MFYSKPLKKLRAAIFRFTLFFLLRHAKQSRYYQGIIDVDSLKSGEVYSKLKESYIIFICLSDIFDKGLPAYHFENLCQENPKIKLNDKAYKYFFIAKNYDKMTDEKRMLGRAFKKDTPESEHRKTERSAKEEIHGIRKTACI